MNQISVSPAELGGKKRVTSRERFLAAMREVTPKKEPVGMIEPQCPGGSRHRPLAGPDGMPRRRYPLPRYHLCAERLEWEVTETSRANSLIRSDQRPALAVATSGRGSSLAATSKNLPPAAASHDPSPPCLLPA